MLITKATVLKILWYGSASFSARPPRRYVGLVKNSDSDNDNDEDDVIIYTPTNLYAQPGLCATVGVSAADQSASCSCLSRRSCVEPRPVSSQQLLSSPAPGIHTCHNHIITDVVDFKIIIT